jgi:homogentisate phytyltransferase/homogentisate geranylgeranyltransferase
MQNNSFMAHLLLLVAALLAVEIAGFQHTIPVRTMIPISSHKTVGSCRYRGPYRPVGKTNTKLQLSDVSIENAIPDESPEKKVPFPIVLWRFTRPHTIIGSALAIPALHFLAAPTLKDAFTTASAVSALFAMIPSLLMNLYITGLNQITDVEIDKINKPNLPIAAGDLSPKTANIIVIISLILSVAMGMAHPVLGSQGLNVALWASGILGTLYSLPHFRLKRFPLMAAFCIVAVRGAVINAGFFAHAKAAAFGVETSVLACLRTDVRCFLSSLFFAVFGIVIGE